MHATTHQLTRLVQDIAIGFTRQDHLLYIEKAFDKIWKDGLIHKLIKLKLPKQLIKIIQSYLQNRTFQVKYKGTLSNKKHADAGVVQGRLLGPILFNIFLHDMSKTKFVKIGLFADDTLIYRTGSHSHREIKLIQDELNVLSEYYQEWKIKINSDKTQGIIFTHKKK